MATKKNAAPKIATKVAAGFPAKSAPSKSVEFDEAKHMEREAAKAAKAKKPTRAKKVEPAITEAPKKPTRPKAYGAKKAVAPAKPPAVLAKSGKLLGADPKGVPGTKAKRTVAVPENGLSGVPAHKVTTVAELAKVCGDFPRGSTFDIMDNRLDVYNLRGRLIAEVRHVAKK